MEWTDALLLFPTAILAGAMNAVAGGGSFFTFPMLIFTGMPPIAANATNTMALWPGSVASVGAYRHELAVNRHLLPSLLATSLIGGLLGAVVLLKTPERTFTALIPFLLLAATLLFHFSPRIAAYTRKRSTEGTATARQKWAGSALQLVIATYGGYFGGGIGILMLSILGLMGLTNIHQMNAIKTLLATFINGIAVIAFVMAGAIVWPQAVIMIIGAIIGGYGGARIARKIPQHYIRRFIVTVGLALSGYFFLS